MEIPTAETMFSCSFDFVQLPDGRWAGKCFYPQGGWVIYVSLEAYAKNKTPERFKYEPCEAADKNTVDLYYKLTY